MANIGRQPCDEGVIRSGKAESPCTLVSGPWILVGTIIGVSTSPIGPSVAFSREANETYLCPTR